MPSPRAPESQRPALPPPPCGGAAALGLSQIPFPLASRSLSPLQPGEANRRQPRTREAAPPARPQVQEETPVPGLSPSRCTQGLRTHPSHGQVRQGPLRLHGPQCQRAVGAQGRSPGGEWRGVGGRGSERLHDEGPSASADPFPPPSPSLGSSPPPSPPRSLAEGGPSAAVSPEGALSRSGPSTQQGLVIRAHPWGRLEAPPACAANPDPGRQGRTVGRAGGGRPRSTARLRPRAPDPAGGPETACG